MSGPTSKVEICNLALAQLKHEQVSDIDAPSTNTEKICALHYDQVRRELLRSYVWNFATDRYLASRSGTPAFDYADKYQLPNRCLRIIAIGGDRWGGYRRDYDIQGREILIDNSGAPTLKLRYTQDFEDVGKMDPLFIGMLSYALADRLAYELSLKNSVIQRIQQQYALLERKATSVDGQERPPRKIERSKALAARRGHLHPYEDDTRYITFS